VISTTVTKLLKVAIKNIDEGTPSGAREILEALTSESGNKDDVETERG